jgi:hypothetical protein
MHDARRISAPPGQGRQGNPPQRGRRRWQLGLGALLLALLALAPLALAQNQAQERLLKAAYVYNFAKFTQWPTSAFPGDTSPLTLCIVGQDGLAAQLRQLGGRQAKGRSLEVRQVGGDAIPDDCQMAYLARSASGSQSGLLESIGDRPVLTISQTRRFGISGGIIELYQRNGKIRFSINQAAASRAGLRISSRLLKLADGLGG